MQYPARCRIIWRMIVCCILLLFLSGGCTSTEDRDGPPRDPTPSVKVPEASGTSTFGTEEILIDASNTAKGYIMLNYSGRNEKVKLQIKTPTGVEYTYLVTDYGSCCAYPLSEGDGVYSVSVYESASVTDDLYAVAFATEVKVSIEDEFSPYLYPNHYIDFTPESASVKKSSQLAADCYSDLDVVTNIYNFVIENISYDTEKAKNAVSGYTPNPDETLDSGTGICFDYASLMTAMLRAQRIPAKLEVGYAGEVYHAWISCYVDEIGWVDNIIEFNGKSWSLLDPTLASNNDAADVKEYIGDGSNYMIKYTY